VRERVCEREKGDIREMGQQRGADKGRRQAQSGEWIARKGTLDGEFSHVHVSQILAYLMIQVL
jgi:hypothetical protein